MDQKIDELTQRVIKLRKYVQDITNGKNPAPLSKSRRQAKRSREPMIYNEIPQDVLDKSYAIFKSYKDLQKLKNAKLCKHCLAIWIESFYRKNPNFIEGKNMSHSDQKQIEEDLSDHFNNNEFDPLPKKNEFQHFYGDDEPTEDDSSLKQIIELRIPAGE